MIPRIARLVYLIRHYIPIVLFLRVKKRKTTMDKDTAIIILAVFLFVNLFFHIWDHFSLRGKIKRLKKQIARTHVICHPVKGGLEIDEVVLCGDNRAPTGGICQIGNADEEFLSQVRDQMVETEEKEKENARPTEKTR